MSVQVCPAVLFQTVIYIDLSAWIIREILARTLRLAPTAVWHGPPIPHICITTPFTMTRDNAQRNISPSFSASPPDRGHLSHTSPQAHHQHRQFRDTAAPSSQTAIFRAAAPPLIFAVLVAGLLVELRARLAPPPPPPPPPGIGATVTVVGNTAAQRVLIWAEARWPGIWALPVLCAGAVGVLRAAIWAAAVVLDGLEELGVPRGEVDGVRVGRWEDGGSVSGSDLLAGVFT
ncbi:hypothetical protein V8E53_004880 [Lactarius tabidus]